jgi:alkylation response protein AidB-like acyl-CoA dehydrogenase
MSSLVLSRRDIEFLLFEWLEVIRLTARPAFSEHSRQTFDAALDTYSEIAHAEFAPHNKKVDRDPPRLVGDNVESIPEQRAAWEAFAEAGLLAACQDESLGGMRLPCVVERAGLAFVFAACPATTSYAFLTMANANLLLIYGTPSQIERFARPMLEGKWTGTMCLSEPHAGSDVGAAKTRAKHLEGNVYSIKGTKCWISAGDHDLADNIIHLVLARIEGAPAGTQGISLFIVPKIWVNEDGSLGEPNDVTTASIEHKLGIRASATAVLNFGENDGCRGILVGGKPHMGMKQMFRMMNGARIAVGVQGLSVASSAYLNALRYARERLQGSSVRHFKDPNAARVPIIEHSDVRRMLVEMKAKVEGMRTLCVKLALHADLAHGLQKVDEAKAIYHQGQVDLLTPIVKAYCSDQAFRVAELAIQTYGGAGYVQDNPVEQYCRDAKIFSIYEGTNHIQALDLVARKLQQHGGENFTAFLTEISEFVAAHSEKPGMGAEVRALGEASTAMQRAAGSLMEYFMSGKIDQVTLVANPFLEVMADVTIAHLLLDAAIVADEKRTSDEDEPNQAEIDFYSGKVMAAKHFVNFVLPSVHAKVGAIVSGDRSALDMPDGGFSTAF